MAYPTQLTNRKVSDVYANWGTLKIASILHIEECYPFKHGLANDVRRMNNGGFSAMTDEEY
ncbi:hypothetical protein T4A_3896 [Trichinella pseudospiralis]|uniref:Uncharacterized protein n=1 Tax=Trichinella pseudospiralis TaxID=6337 RepID=A0A0V1ECK4_TRIPS|nr:hypothetical protein T4A_3896 [Trichinella pseudospiralis]KRY88211.1 hypothetical protein T4D_1138 [Trichinella pseudospiralis]KRZ22423.1 hypothetical protein T4C_6880 [Trichinella pseudospiralis]KRZ27671.1 hypothetical protein T4C_9832 [Trichinella pseudospiralis]